MDRTRQTNRQNDRQPRIFDHRNDLFVMNAGYVGAVDSLNSVADVKSSAPVGRTILHYFTCTGKTNDENSVRFWMIKR